MTHVSAIGVAAFLVIGLAAIGNGNAQPLTVEQVLDKWALALGGKEKLLSIRNSHSLAQVKTSGLTGTIDDYWSNDGRSAYYLALANGAVKISGGCNGDACWQKDMNGQTRLLEGAERQGAITGQYLSQNLQFFPERRTGTVALRESSNPKEVALEIAPKDGKAVTYFLDRETYLPIRSEVQDDDRRQTTWYRNWRSMGGLMIAMEVQQGTGDTLRDMFFAVEKYEANIPLPDSVFASPTGRARDYTFTSGSQATDIQFELTSNHVYVPVQVNGSRRLWFIFDSGAEMSVVSKRSAEELKLTTSGDLEGRGGGEGSVSVSLAQSLTYELPGVTVTNQIAAVVPFDPLEPIAGRHIDGVLGYDFLSRFVIRIDYAKRLLTLTEPSAFTYTGAAQPITFELQKNLPIVPVEVTVAGCPVIKGKFLMDTGMRGAMSLSSPTVRANDMIACAARSVAAPIDFGVGGQSRTHITRAATVTIGDQTVKNLVIGLSLDTLGAGASSDQSGSFGGEILRRFTVTFDYSRQQLFLEPNGSLADPHEYDMSGLRLVLGTDMKEEINVMEVMADSPAEKAGLKAGDIMTAVNNEPVSGKKLWDIRELFKGESGSQVTVTYLRGGVTRNATLTLERLI